ncbi:penicillin-binding transpeptidase domain-containing protein [Tepidiforma flava]|uniref:Penicillin-binding transpeptidase domain-containing protein n=1 Tax=Tepidiforma flava TaxID=3004094 RepID=A0ABY7M1Z0_9CHLR|nr:penicillin-binding transpeptidase domain-containing protein [Tepidiforma flava]WBL34747.1 penicillin-binding transpeptidase domain-containing protein [Tepidiforma flava]
MPVRAAFIAAIIIGLLAGGAVAGARLLASRGGPGEAAAEPEPGSPAAAAAEFAAAWSAGDYQALYLLLSPASQRAYAFEAFADAYRTFEEQLTVTGTAVRVAAVDGASARLDVRLDTAYFGTLEYSTDLELVPAPARYLAAWDPSAIHPRMAGGYTFNSIIQRPVRGTIYDRNGIELAVTRDIRHVGLNRSVITDRAALEAALLQFGFTREQVDAAFASPAPLNHRVRVGPIPEDKVELANQLLRPFQGIVIYVESQRVHPLGPAAAHVVGYTREYTAEELAARKGQGYRPGDRTGAVGLEALLDDRLAGAIGAELRLIAPDGAVAEVLISRPFRQGEDIRTTLDAPTLQRAYERLGGRAGAAVVIDPATNDILALVSSPSFDPDAFERGDAAALAAITAAPGAPLANRAASGLYAPGSTFKLITGAAGMVYLGLTPTDRLECGAAWYGVDPPRRNWEGAQGMLTIAEALMRSCNPVFYEIGLRLYENFDDALAGMARQFGLGAPTGTVGVVEEAGLVPDAAWKRRATGQPWYPGDEVNLSIGQGDLQVTPLQLANAYSTFVTGQLRTPRLLAGAEAIVRGTLPLTPEQHAHLQRGLELVTGPSGTASAAFALAGYTNFAGKSGTAEDANQQSHALFVAMTPARQPRAIAAVVLDDGKSGSIEAGPIARDILLAAVR